MSNLMFKDRPYVMIGYGGHAKVLEEILQLQKCKLHGYIAPEKIDCHLNYLGNDEEFIAQTSSEDFYLVNGVGSIKNMRTRESIYLKYIQKKFDFPNVIHPKTILSPSLRMAKGIQILSGAIINSHVRIEANSLINTGAIIEHDCKIGKHCHIASGAILCGNVSLADAVHIGSGSRLLQNISIGSQSTIGLGAIVTNDIPENSTAYGIPAKIH